MTKRKSEEHGKLRAAGANGGPAHRPVLSVLEATGPTRGIALVLHGGKSHSYEPV